MKLPLQALRPFLAYPLTEQQVAHALEALGVEIDRVYRLQCDTKVVVAHVLDVAPHPQASRLQLATLATGAEPITVVCGAANCRRGMVTAFAPVGATLGKETLQAATIRGVESPGMLCSGEELGLFGSNGILELAADRVAGASIHTVVTDPIFEITLTPNLGYLQSIFGIARAIRTFYGYPAPPYPTSAWVPTTVASHPAATDFAYAHLTLTECVRPDALLWHGIEHSNTLVALAHYVTALYGIPLHVYHAPAVEGSLRLEHPTPGTTFAALNGTTYTLQADDLVVCDAQQPHALAGVVGGAASQARSSSTDILVEAAAFDPTAIRRMAQRYGATEASRLFERGVDSACIEGALATFAALTGATLVHYAGAFSTPKNRTIAVPLHRLQRIVGSVIEEKSWELLLERAGLLLLQKTAQQLTVGIPTYRHDLLCPEDVIEEMVKMHGLASWPSTVSHYTPSTLQDAPAITATRLAKQHCVTLGLQEVRTPPLIGPTMATYTVEEEPMLRLKNPQGKDFSLLRNTLIPGMLKVILHNFTHGVPCGHFFEVGKLFFPAVEKTAVAVALYGAADPHWLPTPPIDFFTLKARIEGWCTLWGSRFTYVPSHDPLFHPGRQAALMCGTEQIGICGQLHPEKGEALGVRTTPIYLATWHLPPAEKAPFVFQPLPTQPAITRDWTFDVCGVQWNALCRAVPSHPYCVSYRLISDFVDADTHRQTVRFTYRHPTKTLTTEEVDAIHADLLSQLQRELLL